MTAQTGSTLLLLQDLVSIDSVNPALVCGGRGEAEIARRVASECTAAGLTVHVTDVAPSRPNVVGVLDGRAPGPTLMCCGHIDTVGVTGMAAPFDPVQRDGRLYGLGAQDMKGGLAVMLGAASLHASTVATNGELSSDPAHCLMQMERRTLPGEPRSAGVQEVEAILERLRSDDWECDGSVRLMSGREPYEVERAHALPRALDRAATSVGFHARRVGMTYWSDAAILGAAGMPSVLFGPGGAGLHGPEEYVRLKDVCTCRDTLVALAREFTG